MQSQVYDGANGELRTEIDSLRRPEDAFDVGMTQPVVFLPDGSLVIGSMAGPLRFVDPTDGTEVTTHRAAPLTRRTFLLTSDAPNRDPGATVGSATGQPVVTF